jgi:hypothetical protein
VTARVVGVRSGEGDGRRRLAGLDRLATHGGTSCRRPPQRCHAKLSCRTQPAPMDSGVGVRAGVAVPSGLPRARSGGRIPSAGLGLDASPRSVAADACGVGVIPASCANK